MAGQAEFSPAADRPLNQLDPQDARRILKFLSCPVARLETPGSLGQAQQGQCFGEFWKYRVGDSLICRIEDEEILILSLANWSPP